MHLVDRDRLDPSLLLCPSGDLCQSTCRIDGVRKLRLVMAARYFPRFELCVSDPKSLEVCKTLRVRARGDGTFGRSVRWRRAFGYGGAGAYTVTWYRVPRYGPPTRRIGEVLGFHVS